jgi:hypothetical protein
LTSTLIGLTLTIITYFYQEQFAEERRSRAGKKKFQKWKEKIIVDVNAIMLENMKKMIGASSTTPNKVITEVSLPQEGDTGETISETTTDIDNPTAASNVVSKTIKVVVQEK